MRDSLRATRILALMSVVSAAGCSPTEEAGLATVVDSAGIRIVQHDPNLPPLATWTLIDPPEAIIGGRADSEESHQFTQIRGAVRMSDGRIVVGDWGSREARYFDASGNHLSTVGGRGEGPGEMRNLYRVDRIDGDTLVVGGWPIGSRYWFDEKGDFIRNQALGPWFPGMLGRTLLDGSLVLDTYEHGSHGNTLEYWAANGPDEDLRPTGVLELVSREGTRVDTLGEIRAQTWHKSGRLRVNFAMHALPFAPTGLVAWSRRHVFVGHTERPEVQAFDRTGEVVMIVRWSPQPVSVGGADRRRFRDDVLAGIRLPEQRPNLERWLSEISYPSTKPTFAGLFSDATGHLWIQRTAASSDLTQVWTIHGPDGIAMATLEMPIELEVLSVDATHVLAKVTDELGVEAVRSYRFSR